MGLVAAAILACTGALPVAAASAVPLASLPRVLPLPPEDVACGEPAALESWLADETRAAVAPAVPAGAELGSPHVRRSLSGWTLRFPETRQGLAIEGAQIVVSLVPDGLGGLEARVVADGLVPVPETILPPAQVDAAEAQRIALDALLRVKPVAPKVVRDVRAAAPQLDRTGSAPAWSVVVRGADPAIDLRVLVDAVDGRILDVRDLLARVAGQGDVFDPNPIATMRDITLRDGADAASAVPLAAYSSQPLLGLDAPVGGLHRLSGEIVSVEDFLPPLDAPATEASAAGFVYERDDDRFEQVMVYRNVDRLVRHVRSLGYADLPSRVIRADAHAQGVEGSFFTAADFSLGFGDGGVDDAEDADVVVHEAVHALMEDVIPGFATTGEAGAVGEGAADYLAASLHAAVAGFPACVAAWDSSEYSTTSPPCRNRVDTLKIYPDAMTGDPHADGEVWSSALWGLRRDLGAPLVDTLLVESWHSMTPTATLRDASLAMLQADFDLDAGSRMTVCQGLAARGLLQATDCPTDLSILRVVVDDRNGGDGDGWAEPGETVDLIVTVRSVVRATQTGASVTLTPRTGGLVMVVPTAFYPDLGPRGVADPLVPANRVRVGNLVNCGTSLLFDADVRSDSFSGFASVRITAGEPTPLGAVSGSFNGPPMSIPDDNNTGIESRITLAGPGRVASVLNVDVDITHTYRGDLRVELLSPRGTVVRLHDESGGDADDLITSYPSPTPPDGPGTLAGFIGENVAGDWILHVSDRAANDVGDLNRWAISVDVADVRCASGSACDGQEIATGVDGLLMVSKSGDEIVLDFPPALSPCATGVEVRRSSTPRPLASPATWPLDPPFADITSEDLDPGPQFRHVPPPGLSCYLVVERRPSGLEGPVGAYGR